MAWRDMIPWGRGSEIPVHQDPRVPVSSIQQEMNRMFDRFLEHPFGRMEWPNEPREWRPSVDISETATQFEVSAELPGVDEKDIDLEVSDGMLTLKGTRSEEREDKEKDYHHREQFFGSFRRMIPLPSSVDPEGVKASYKRGVLRVTLPKNEQSRATKVAVSGG